MKTKAAVILIIVGIVLFIGQLISISEYSIALRCGLAGIPFYIGTFILLFDKEKKQPEKMSAEDKEKAEAKAALKEEKKRIRRAKRENNKILKLLDPHKIAIVLVIIGLVCLFIQLITRSEVSIILRCTIASIPAIVGIMIFAVVPERDKNIDDKIETSKVKPTPEINKENRKVEKKENEKIQPKINITNPARKETIARKPSPTRTNYSGTRTNTSKTFEKTKPVEPVKAVPNIAKKEEDNDFRKELAAKIEAKIAAKKEKLNREKELKRAAN
ncbi:MAG: hypothetical protein ACEPOV_05855 [Hyphomicrobiales bacterium]